ncbi:TetR/AcrR family transcriptional regulator [Demequina activiva]|uniref:Transcriptional regulator n=1 Tax=Demequina activiva TaxID=1582364 RepID=A0A919Q5F2_9MICO|nr:TetR/AcrR family transcriptional regulator [Demequina activiva]GIG54848.1 transcriptional regulator [Demequina activiva]
MATLTARDWTVAAATRLATHGADQVRVEPLAEGLGVSKGSFYWHFANRDALLESVLELWEERGTEAIIAHVEAEQSDAQARLRALVHHTFGQPEHDGIELGIRAWAVRDDRARTVAARVDARRIEYVAGLIESCGLAPAAALTRSQLLYRTLIGEFVLRSHGHPRLDERELDRLAATLTREADARP